MGPSFLHRPPRLSSDDSNLCLPSTKVKITNQKVRILRGLTSPGRNTPEIAGSAYFRSWMRGSDMIDRPGILGSAPPDRSWQFIAAGHRPGAHVCGMSASACALRRRIKRCRPPLAHGRRRSSWCSAAGRFRAGASTWIVAAACRYPQTTCQRRPSVSAELP